MLIEPEKLLLKLSTNLFIITDAEGMISYASPKAILLLGLSANKDINISRFLEEGNWKKLKEHLNKVLDSNIPEFFPMRQQNRIFNIYIHSHEGKAFQCWEDITERRQLSQALHRTSERIEFAEKATQVGYWELDIQARRLYWSTEMYRLLGLDARTTSYKQNIIRDHILEEDYPAYKHQLHELILTGKESEGILRLRREDGKIIYCSFKSAFFRDGEKDKIAGIFQNITKLMEMQQEIEKAKQSAEASNRSKSYFLAQASHDLRQPMLALRIFISALEEEKLNKHQKDLLNKISFSANNLTTMLDNLLDMSKLDAEGFKTHENTFNISDLLQNIFFEFHEIARSRGIVFHTTLCHYRVKSDALLVERVVRNLLSNAFKFTNNKVLLGCKREEDFVRVIVMDNGSGIEPDEIDGIFEEFYQSKNINEINRKKGAGLGLAIVKRISDALKLDIQVKSQPGQGSSFSFKLPLAKRL